MNRWAYRLSQATPDGDGCLIVSPSPTYPQLTNEAGRRERGHRVALLVNGTEIPAGHHVHHKCGNPRCVNADHLEVLTHSEHMKVTNAHTHCKRGHDLSEHGHTRPNGKRFCKECRRQMRRAGVWS